jgi:hypothetical protein
MIEDATEGIYRPLPVIRNLCTMQHIDKALLYISTKEERNVDILLSK